MRYSVVLTPAEESDMYTVTVPALPGCVTQGRTVEEALERAEEAIRGFVYALRLGGDPVPVEERPVRLEVLDIEPPVVPEIAGV
jgi:predicted RNase H-like HicB family nuclease